VCNGVQNGCSTGWYTTNVTVSFLIQGGTIVSGCTPVTISVDSPGTPLVDQPRCEVIPQGSNTSTTLYVPIKRDATPPSATGIAAGRGPDANGWYNHAVGVTTTGTDAMSGIASCTSTTYSGPDSGSATVSGTCTDNAGNVSAPKTLAIEYDATPPSASAAPARAADANGWYNHPLTVAFTGTDATSGLDGCTSASYSGPDDASASVSGSCRDKAGNSASASFGVHYDATPPTVDGGKPDRAPDANGWYNHRLQVAFAGTDATSGIASCDTAAYEKPDAAKAAVTGHCRDNAGNVSTAGTFGFKYDSTPPKVSDLTVTSLDGTVTLAWKAAADVAAVRIVRSGGGSKATPVYGGKRTTAFTDKRARNGNRYSYALTALDAAGNETVLKAVAAPAAALLAPRQAALVRGAATLRWRATPHASYYNVQLWLRGKKVLTTWPARPILRLPHLVPGRYTWLVWPGLGPRSQHRYGPLIGRSTFVVTG
jgi:hypothetical protein